MQVEHRPVGWPGSKPLREQIIVANSPTTSETSAERSLQLALAAVRTAEDNRGQNVVVLDMCVITPVFDYFVIASGNSRRQLHAISEEIDHRLEDDLGDKRMGIEGYNESRWILLDYGNVVIHLFDEETRDYYALEDFWGESVEVPLPWHADQPPPESGPPKSGPAELESPGSSSAESESPELGQSESGPSESDAAEPDASPKD